MRNVEAGLGRGEGGSERIREDPRGLGRGRVELRLRAGKTEGLGEFGAFSPFWGESGRGEALSGSFLGREGPQKSTPYPGFKLEFKKTHLKSKNAT